MSAKTLVIGGFTLTEINQDSYGTEYLYRDTATPSLFQLKGKVRHSNVTYGGVKYDRHNVEIVRTTYATASVPEFQRKFYYVWEHLASDTSLNLAHDVCAAAIASSDAFLLLLQQWQS